MFLASLLILNGMCILHEKRFLNKSERAILARASSALLERVFFCARFAAPRQMRGV